MDNDACQVMDCILTSCQPNSMHQLQTHNQKSRADILHDTEIDVLIRLHVIQGLCKTCCLRPHRHNQELEEDSAAMEQERLQLQQQAESLAKRLEAVLSDKFVARTAFDADTPIDKTLAFLQDVIKVSLLARTQDDCKFHRLVLMLWGNVGQQTYVQA